LSIHIGCDCVQILLKQVKNLKNPPTKTIAVNTIGFNRRNLGLSTIPALMKSLKTIDETAL
jgi:hypothetical protein